MNRIPSTARARDDRGFTLVELIISLSILTVVTTIVGSMIISSLRAESTVRDVTGTTTDGQLAVNVIEQTVRNSTAIRVTPAADGVSVHVALRSTVGGTARCHAFFYDAPSDRIFQRSSTSAISAPLPGEVGAEWTVVSAGIVPHVTGSVTAPVFAAEGTRGLTVSFTVDSASGPGALFVTTATGRGPQSNASPQCF